MAGPDFVAATSREIAPLSVWSSDFPRHPIVQSVAQGLTATTQVEAEISEALAAGFVLRRRLELSTGWARVRHWRRPSFNLASLGDLERFGLSATAMNKIRGAFRRPPGARVYHVYLNAPELQAIYPLALLPLGQAHFLSWLAAHGRTDFGLTSEEILWFLYQSAAELERGLVLTYLIRPTWQKEFPLALTDAGWRPFIRALRKAYGRYFPASAFRRVPDPIPVADERVLLASTGTSGDASHPIEGANVMSHFCNTSGIQQAALWTKAALERAGLRTSCRDVPVPRHTIPTNRAEWLGLEIHPITILTNAPTPYFVSAYERAGLFRRPDVYRVAYWAWELERIPDEWLEVAPFADEIWSPTPFVASAMRSAMPLPVYEMLPGVEIGTIETVTRGQLQIPGAHCIYLFMFDLHSQIHRKNPAGVVRAFEQAFRHDDAATLVIKATGGDIFKKDFAMLQRICDSENVRLIHEVMSRERAYGMIAMCDCFVSLHRSEGFGLGMAEAMLLGKPVIATGYSGNLAFMNRENSMLVDYEIVEITDDRPIYTKGNHWAEPSVEHAAQYMRHVYENRDEAVAHAASVQPQIRELLSLEAAGSRMRSRLEEIARKGYHRSLADDEKLGFESAQ